MGSCSLIGDVNNGKRLNLEQRINGVRLQCQAMLMKKLQGKKAGPLWNLINTLWSVFWNRESAHLWSRLCVSIHSDGSVIQVEARFVVASSLWHVTISEFWISNMSGNFGQPAQALTQLGNPQPQPQLQYFYSHCICTRWQTERLEMAWRHNTDRR